jgi:hypothetical protein
MDIPDLFSEALKRIDYISRQPVSYVLSFSGVSLILVSFLTKDAVFGEHDAAQFTTGDFISSMIVAAFLLALGAVIVFAASRTQVNSSVQLAESAQDIAERIQKVAQEAATKAVEAAYKQVNDSGRAITPSQESGRPGGRPDERNPMQEPIGQGGTRR